MTKLPKELDIHSHLDYDTQYEKAFVEPLSFITDNIDWKIDRSYGTKTTLEDTIYIMKEELNEIF